MLWAKVVPSFVYYWIIPKSDANLKTSQDLQAGCWVFCRIGDQDCKIEFSPGLCCRVEPSYGTSRPRIFTESAELKAVSRVTSRVGHDRVFRLLGEGGMGDVYDAIDEENGSRVASSSEAHDSQTMLTVSTVPASPLALSLLGCLLFQLREFKENI
jgi:hypothetical protein